MRDMATDPNAPWLAIVITAFALGAIGLLGLVETELDNNIHEYNLTVENYYQGRQIELPAGFELSYNRTSDGCHVFGGQGGLFAFKLCGVQTRVEDRCVFFFDARTNATQSICQYSNNPIVGPKGATGARGVNGTQGIQGINGTQGYNGTDGPQGVQGDPGERGYNGTKGLAGEKGDRGINGTQGDVGDQGIEGEIGDTGTQGIQGETGDQGAEGLPGNSTFGNNGTKGDTGPDGPDGPQGPTGITGPDGPEGLRGINGTKGVKGATGAKGATGDPGDKGATGPDGADGATGADGAQGVQGKQGATGATGNTGLTGPRGNDAQPSLVDRVIMDSSESRTAVEVTGGSTTVRAAVYHDNGFYGDGSSGSLTLFGSFNSIRTRESQFQNLKLVGTARFITTSLTLYVNDTLDLSESTLDGSIMPLTWNPGIPAGATSGSAAAINTGGLRADGALLTSSAYDRLDTLGTASVVTTTTAPAVSSTCAIGMVGFYGQLGTCSGLQAVAGRSVGVSPAPVFFNGAKSLSVARTMFTILPDTNLNPTIGYSGAASHGYAGQSAQFTTAANAGAGGQGGGVGLILIVKARRIILPNSPVTPFLSPGGQGAHGGPASTSTSAGAGGGGSGGQGGPVVLYYNELVGTMLAPLVRVDGGYGGDGGRGLGTTGTAATGGAGGTGGGCGIYTVYDTGQGRLYQGPTSMLSANVGPSISGQEFGSSGVRGCRMHWPFNYQTEVTEINAVGLFTMSSTHGILGNCIKMTRDGQFLYFTMRPPSADLVGSRIVIYRQSPPGVWTQVFRYHPVTASTPGDLGGMNTCALNPDGTQFVVYYKRTAATYSFIRLTKTGDATWTADETPSFGTVVSGSVVSTTVFMSMNGDGNTVVMRTMANTAGDDTMRLFTYSGSWSLTSAAIDTGPCVSLLWEGPSYTALNGSFVLVAGFRASSPGFCHLSSTLTPIAWYPVRNSSTSNSGGTWQIHPAAITASDDGNVVYLVTANDIGRPSIAMFATRSSGGSWSELGTGVYLRADHAAAHAGGSVPASISCTPDGSVVFLGYPYASTPMGQVWGFRRIGDRLWPFANPMSSRKSLDTSASFGCSVSVSSDGLTVAASSCPTFATGTRTQPRILIFKYQDGIQGTPPRAVPKGTVLLAREDVTWGTRVAMSANGWAVASRPRVMFRRRHGTRHARFVRPAVGITDTYVSSPVTMLDHGGTAALFIGEGAALALVANFRACTWSTCTVTTNTLTTLASSSVPYSACATRSLDFVYVSFGTTLALRMARTAVFTQIGSVTLASNDNARHRAYMGCSSAGEFVAVLRPSPLAVWVYTLSQFADPAAMGTTPVTLSPLDNPDAAVGTHLSVSADGSTIVAAAANQLWTFRRTGGVWAQVGSRLMVASIEVAVVHLRGKYLWTLSATELDLWHWKDGAYKIYQDRVGHFPAGNAVSLAASYNGTMCTVAFYNASLDETRAQMFFISQLPMTRTELGDPVKRLPKEVVLTRATGAPPRAVFGSALKLSKDGNWLAMNWYAYNTNMGAIGIFHRDASTRSYLAVNEALGTVSGGGIGHSMCICSPPTGQLVLIDRMFTGAFQAWTFDSTTKFVDVAHTSPATVSTTGAATLAESNAMLVCGKTSNQIFVMSGRVGTGLNSITARIYTIGVGFNTFPDGDLPKPAEVVASTSSWGSALAMSDTSLVLIVYARVTTTGPGDDAYYVYRRAATGDTWGSPLQVITMYVYVQQGLVNPPSVNRDGSIITFAAKTGAASGTDSVSTFVYTWVPAASKYVLTSVPAAFNENLHTGAVTATQFSLPQQVEVSGNGERLFFTFPQLTGSGTGANLFYYRRVTGETDYYTIDGTLHVGPYVQNTANRHSMSMSADGETMVSTETFLTNDMRVNVLEVDRL